MLVRFVAKRSPIHMYCQAIISFTRARRNISKCHMPEWIWVDSWQIHQQMHKLNTQMRNDFVLCLLERCAAVIHAESDSLNHIT